MGLRVFLAVIGLVGAFGPGLFGAGRGEVSGGGPSEVKLENGDESCPEGMRFFDHELLAGYEGRVRALRDVITDAMGDPAGVEVSVVRYYESEAQVGLQMQLADAFSSGILADAGLGRPESQDYGVRGGGGGLRQRSCGCAFFGAGSASGRGVSVCLESGAERGGGCGE